MTNTALGAGAEKAQEIIFISEAHEKFYYEKLKEVRYQDVYHKALCYCLGINDDTRRNANRIYDFKTGCVKTECLHEGWQTSGSVKVVRMAFNLYCNATPSVDDYTDAEEQINECRKYTVEELFCCAYIQTAKANLPVDKEQFSMKVGDKLYTDKKEAGTALVEMCKEIKTVNALRSLANMQVLRWQYHLMHSTTNS